ncbi:Glycosyltransferase involved in cell wall bisynthesis [Burkholderia sp. WP9]|uniref:glycosyltransferase family 4 protein n=1 Tax=Burkholderia sp. WP9 TaxID=1500263 RepID=UPI00089D550F|nr:glycosyltransferase family 4 protein [Burkholderia sp. WP9]SED08084.1 Glycosyltransferase involved in cell wall bisynthesis [Burkholderia sp. WP9]
MNTQLSVLNVSQNHFVRGGSDRYFLSLGDLLSRQGNLVVPFCARSEKDQPSEWSTYFPPGADFESPSVLDVLKYHYSPAAKNNLRKLVSGNRFDIAHLHIYYGKLTSSILPVLKDAGIPIVQTAHDYKLICPVYSCSRGGKACEECRGKEYWRAMVYKCNRGSYLRSAISMSESYVSRWLGSVDTIDRFIAVSQFSAARMGVNGIDPSRISVVPNFIDVEQFTPQTETGRYFVYFGRIEHSKGIGTLVKAFMQLPDIPLMVIGEGGLLPEVQALAATSPNIHFAGFKNGSELYSLVGQSVASILPSEWYENCPMAILESFALGRPVIGTRIGGVPELISQGEDGYLIDPGDVDSLCAAVRGLWERRGDHEMGRAARRKAEHEFSSEIHYRRIRDVYDSLRGT